MVSNELLHRFNSERLDDRMVSELIGLCHGVVADGVANQGEADFLEKWMMANRSAMKIR